MSDKGSIIPPGQADIAYQLSQLPQVSEYDCDLHLDQLLMSGINHIARETGETVDGVGKRMAYDWLRMYFAGKVVEQIQAKGENNE